jgi:hypothetical protein
LQEAVYLAENTVTLTPLFSALTKIVALTPLDSAVPENPRGPGGSLKSVFDADDLGKERRVNQKEKRPPRNIRDGRQEFWDGLFKPARQRARFHRIQAS